MAETFQGGGREGRSVLGRLEVRVERDPKTGATVIRSVAPVSASAGAPAAVAVFDDGRKTIHAVGGSGSRPSPEELGQILNAVDGVGMKVLLDEVSDADARRTAQEAKEDARLDGGRRTVVVRDAGGEVGHVEERGPVTTLFVGYTDATAGQSPEVQEGGVTVERVVITEGGEDPETLEEVTEREAGKETSAAEGGGTSCQCCRVL